MAGAVTAEGDRPWPFASVTKIWIPAIMRFIAPFIGLDADGHAGVLPQEDVVLEIHRRSGELDGENGHELTVEVVRHTAERLRLRGCFNENGTFHGCLLRR